jgi:DNA-binding CsgD family transcriptional regulator
MELPEQTPAAAPAVLVLVTTIAPGTDRLRLASLPPAEAQRVVDALLGRAGSGRAPRRPRTGPADWGRLTDLELQIADLVRQAMTNRQIATRVGKSPHTVNYHLRQIFRKLGISSRVELAGLTGRGHAGTRPGDA